MHALTVSVNLSLKLFVIQFHILVKLMFSFLKGSSLRDRHSGVIGRRKRIPTFLRFQKNGSCKVNVEGSFQTRKVSLLMTSSKMLILLNAPFVAEKRELWEKGLKVFLGSV